MPKSRWFSLTPGMLLRMLADAALMNAALFAAVALRFLVVVGFENPPDVGEILQRDITGFFHASWVLTVIALGIFYVFGFYTYGKYYLGKYKLVVVSQAVSVAYLLFGFLWYFFAQGIDPAEQSLPVARGAFTLAWGLSVLLLGGARIWNQLSKRIVEPEREFIIRANRGHRHVLVIGGAGYIGSALLPRLLSKGHRVRVLDLFFFGESPISQFANSPNLEIIRGDFRHVENVVEAMRDIDSVIHLGAIVGDPACKLDEDLTIDINLSATRMLAQLAKTANVDRFLFASTCSVYGACEEIIDERSQVRPVSLYGHTKAASEDVLLRSADDRFKPTILRFATIYGLSGRTRFDLVINLMTAQAKINGEVTVHGGEQWRPFVHVEDAARAIATLLDAPRETIASQIFNVGSNSQNHTILQVGEMVHAQVVGSRLVIKSDDIDPRNYRTSFNKIHNLLGFEPEWTIAEGIQQVLEAIAGGEIVDYRDPQYSNVRFLTEEGTSSFARNRWAHEMIQTFTNE